MSTRTYPAKLLLFGEYTVLSDSQALAVPLTRWSAVWTKGHEINSLQSLDFFHWLKSAGLTDEAQLDRMIADLRSGWIVQSDIPMGHGVGSSGAFVAAVYDRYFEKSINPIHAAKIMAAMESFFHGTSSGMDPLVSLEHKAILKDDRGNFQLVNDPGWPRGYKVYLWDSGLGRTTNSLVQLYKQKMQDEDFALHIHRSLIPAIDHAIHFYLTSTDAMLEDCIQVISQFQFDQFEEMIPDPVKITWEKCNGMHGVYMKLCGAGGGGFYLIISTGKEDLAWPSLFKI